MSSKLTTDSRVIFFWEQMFVESGKIFVSGQGINLLNTQGVPVNLHTSLFSKEVLLFSFRGKKVVNIVKGIF